MFRVLSAPIIRSTLKLQMQSQAQVMYQCSVGLDLLKGVQGQESTSVLLMMGVESTRNMYSKFAVYHKDDCLKLHHVGYFINIKYFL
jgi:hypothetical protein